MPWQQQWVEAPKDLRLPVLAELPDGVRELEFPFGYKEAYGQGRRFYSCRYCGGWIEGQPNSFPVNTLGPLSGRQGTEYHCRRCGEQIHFDGIMS